MKQAFFIVSFLLLTASAWSQAVDYDGIIYDGLIVDGTGGAPYVADVAISGDTIAAIGDLREDGLRTRYGFRANHHIVAPGFIDIHSHGRRGIFDHPDAENYLRQGVTTFIDGQDGNSPLPLGPFLERAAGWGIAINMGLLVGQGSVRRAVIGLENRRSTPAEIRKMKELVAQAMRDGAFGISTGLFYIPGAYTPTEEIIELAKVAGAYGGFHCSHMRDEAEGILESVRECIRIGEEGGLPTQLTHHKIIGRDNWGISVRTLALIEEARNRGVDVTIDQYPYTASSTGTRAMFPQWAQEGGRDGLMARLDDANERAKIKADIVRRLKYDRGGGDPKNVVLVSCGFDESLAGMNLAEVTAAKGREVNFRNAAETAIEIQRAGGCSAIYHAISEDDVRRIMQFPFTMIASDGGIPAFGAGVPHPRSYGTFARVLGHYSRDRKLFPIEEAVRKMTSLPASRLGLQDRGWLRVGMKADIVVFDPREVIDRAEFLSPHRYAEGVDYVIVNGQPVWIRSQGVTGRKPGRVLYGPAKE